MAGSEAGDANVTLYGLGACDTCRKAARELVEGGLTVTRVDVRNNPLSADQIARFLDAFGDALINRKSTTWRGLSDTDRDQAASDLLAANPALMKRPVIHGPQGLTLGWTTDAKAVHLG